MSTSTQRRGNWLSAKEVAAELGVDPASVYRAVRAGHIRALRLGDRGRIHIARSEFDRLLSGAEREAS
jgi:excisionase family DNA binding protein